MILFKRSLELAKYLESRRNSGLRIGFVPTMGALHNGHISLIKASMGVTDLTVCSIFVNPTQFNDPKDFKKYPITLEKDIYLLEKNGTHVLFLPDPAEIYPDGTHHLEHYDLGYLETILEGQYRPGHFQGVCQVMHRLLRIVGPTDLFMGEKDYQQCLVIKRLLETGGSQPSFHTCPTLRESDGLAMSSRNLRLGDIERANAPAIYEALQWIREHLHSGDLSGLVENARSRLMERGFRVDYIELARAENLEKMVQWDGHSPLVALIAAFQGETRLIDNLVLAH